MLSRGSKELHKSLRLSNSTITRKKLLVMRLTLATPFTSPKIYAAQYSDCADLDPVITAGALKTRLEEKSS